MYKMKTDKGKLGDTKFKTDGTPYANENVVYGKSRADKKSKMPKPDIRPFG